MMDCCQDVCFPVVGAVAATGWFLWLLTLSRVVSGAPPRERPAAGPPDSAG